MKRSEVKSASKVVYSYLETKEQCRQVIASTGSKLVEHACSMMSLRELARQTGLSITYLSLTKNKKQSISPDAFLSVTRAIDKHEQQARNKSK